MSLADSGKRIGYFGKEGSYTHTASQKMFGNVNEFLSFPSIQKLFQAVEEGTMDQGVVPIENSVEGTVGITNDMLYRSSLFITGEFFLRITHCLIVKPGLKLKDVKYVISHPQALGQCSEFLWKNSLEGIPFTDTASSVSALNDGKYAGYAAISSRETASRYGMEVLLEDIGDYKDNYTRFVSVSRSQNNDFGDRSRVSVVVSVDHRPGSLKEVLEIYHRHGINLTRIESRPVKHSPWRYIFFLDSQGTSDTEDALTELQKKCPDYKFLGRYPSSSPD